MAMLAVIPARGGSKRLPDKNIRRFSNGKSLLDLTNDAILASGVACETLLTTDSHVIAENGRELGWWVPFLRPADLAADDTATLPVVLHALDWYREERGSDPELTLLLQVTSPLRKGGHIAAAMEMLRIYPDCDAVIGVHRLGVSSTHVYSAAPGDGYLDPIAPEVAVPASVFVPNGAIYLIRTAALRREQTFFPPRTRGYEMDAVASVDVDTESDWCLAEALLSHTEPSKGP